MKKVLTFGLMLFVAIAAVAQNFDYGVIGGLVLSHPKGLRTNPGFSVGAKGMLALGDNPSHGFIDMQLKFTSRGWKDDIAVTGEDGRVTLTHERLVKARRSLVRLVNAGTLFTYLDPELVRDGPLPSTNNRIEGGVNAQLRAMLRDHRGLSIERRLKAIFWWCYMHSPSPLPAAEVLRVMPTDRSVAAIYERLGERERLEGTIPRWGDAIVWSELHHSEPYRMDWD